MASESGGTGDDQHRDWNERIRATMDGVDSLVDHGRPGGFAAIVAPADHGTMGFRTAALGKSGRSSERRDREEPE